MRNDDERFPKRLVDIFDVDPDFGKNGILAGLSLCFAIAAGFPVEWPKPEFRNLPS
jgi:hypothetical protein